MKNEPTQHASLNEQDASRLSELRIQTLLSRLGWAAPLALVLVSLLVVGCFYLLQARPLAKRYAEAERREA